MFQIVRALPRDWTVLKEIAIVSKGYWGYPDPLMAQWALTPIITPESITVDCVYMARVGLSAVGWYRLSIISITTILDDLWVLPTFIGKGIGRGLFEHAIGQARQYGAHDIELDADPHAAPFYEKMGCRVIGESVTEWGRAIPRMRYTLQSDPVS